MDIPERPGIMRSSTISLRYGRPTTWQSPRRRETSIEMQAEMGTQVHRAVAPCINLHTVDNDGNKGPSFRNASHVCHTLRFSWAILVTGGQSPDTYAPTLEFICSATTEIFAPR